MLAIGVRDEHAIYRLAAKQLGYLETAHNLYRLLYSESMSVLEPPTRVLSVTEATVRGVAGLVKDSEHGTDTVVERHGRPVAAVVSIQHFSELRDLEQDLRSAALVLSRAATDNGQRTGLDEVIAGFGLTREELQQERRDDAAANRE